MTIAFLTIFIAGFALSVISWVFGELFEFGGDVVEGLSDIDFTPDLATGGAVDLAAAEGATPSPASSRVVFSALTAFGGFGFIGSSLGWPLAGTLAFALGGAAVTSAAMFFGVIVPIARQQGSVRVDRRGYLGLEVSVATGIPQGGVGQVTFADPGSGALVTEAASSQDGRPIPQGAAVKIVRVDAGGVVVARAT